MKNWVAVDTANRHKTPQNVTKHHKTQHFQGNFRSFIINKKCQLLVDTITKAGKKRVVFRNYEYFVMRLSNKCG